VSTSPTPTPATTTTTTTQLQKIGQIIELAGVGAFAGGIILSAHHYAIGALCVGGALAYLVGRKLRGLS
jgi:hypothetical protein